MRITNPKTCVIAVAGVAVGFAVTWSGTGAVPTDLPMLRSPRSVISDKRTTERELVRAIRALGPTNEPASFWNDIAADSRYSDLHRRHAVLQLFRRHIAINSRLEELGRTLRGASWLRAKDVQKKYCFSGACPLEISENDSVFLVWVFSQIQPNRVVILHLSEDIENDELIDLIDGKPVRKQVREAVILNVLFAPRLAELYGP